MPKLPLIVASITALLTFGASAPASAQSQSNSSQSVPDAPQPQKKPAAKPQSSDPSQPTTRPTLSRQLRTSRHRSRLPRRTTIPFLRMFPSRPQSGRPVSDSDHPADPDATAPKPSTATDNPFPESVSRDAAKAAGNDPAPAAKPDIPPGFSSSRSESRGRTRWPIRRAPKRMPRWVAFT